LNNVFTALVRLCFQPSPGVLLTLGSRNAA
jgi:hypothetical protein